MAGAATVPHQGRLLPRLPLPPHCPSKKVIAMARADPEALAVGPELRTLSVNIWGVNNAQASLSSQLLPAAQKPFSKGKARVSPPPTSGLPDKSGHRQKQHGLGQPGAVCSHPLPLGCPRASVLEHLSDRLLPCRDSRTRLWDQNDTWPALVLTMAFLDCCPQSRITQPGVMMSLNELLGSP